MPSYGGLTVPGLSLEELARFVADVTNGHDHDGVNSKAIAAAIAPPYLNVGTTAGYVNVNPDVALAGSAPNPLIVDVRYATASATTTLLASFMLHQTAGMSSGSTQVLEAYNVMTHASGNVPLALGLIANMDLSGAGNVGELRGYTTTILNRSTGTITTAIGYHVAGGLKDGGGTITTLYGIKIDNLTIGTTNWSIFTGSAPSYFGAPITAAGSLKSEHATNPYLWLSKTGATARTGHVELESNHFRIYYDGAARFLANADGASEYNAPTAQSHQFQLNGTVEVTLDAAGINLAAGNVLKVNGDRVVRERLSGIGGMTETPAAGWETEAQGKLHALINRLGSDSGHGLTTEASSYLE